MTAPLLPLDVLAGYTVTREGPHFYTLTPIERTATMDETPTREEVIDDLVESHGISRAEAAATIATWGTESSDEHRATMDMDEQCPRCRFHGGYHAEDCDYVEELTDESDLYATRAEWREVPQ